MGWHFSQDGIERGPIDGAELYELIASGKLLPETPIRREGETDFRPFASYFPSRAELPPKAPTTEPPLTIAALNSMERCWQCGRHQDPDDLIVLAGRSICGDCKAAFAQRLREGIHPAHRDLQLATFGRRAAGKLVDFALLFVMTNALLRWRLLQVVVLGPFHGVNRTTIWIGFSLLFTLTLTSLYTFLLHGCSGQTLGKLLVETRVVRPDGMPISFPQSAARSAAEILSRILLLGYFVAVADAEVRTLHDRTADTRVIRV